MKTCKTIGLRLLAAAGLIIPGTVLAQNIGDFSYKFYGQVRNDVFYMSRQSMTSEEGTFYFFPLDNDYDANGKDINSGAEVNLFNMRTRLGVDITGPEILGAKTSAKIETDFRGNSSTIGLLRVRHAYVKLDWNKSSLLLGQTWHPLVGDVTPETLDITTGTPFNADGRSPQIRYVYDDGAMRLTFATLWQAQYASIGPNGSSTDYQRDSNVPDMFAGIEYHNTNFVAGIGVDMLTLKLRNETELGYKASERITSFSAEAHAKYSKSNWQVSGASYLTANATMLNLLGGYGTSSIDEVTGEREYAPLRISHSWISAGIGTTWRVNAMVGYAKNLGATKGVTELTGRGTDIDRLASGLMGISYNQPHYKIGFEYNFVSAWYGTPDYKGRVKDTHNVDVHRLLLSTVYIF